MQLPPKPIAVLALLALLLATLSISSFNSRMPEIEEFRSIHVSPHDDHESAASSAQDGAELAYEAELSYEQPARAPRPRPKSTLNLAENVECPHVVKCSAKWPHQTLFSLLAEVSPQRLFFAVNLRNSEEVIPTMVCELERLISAVGETHIFISIFENDSTDNSSSLLASFATKLDSLGVRNRITHGLSGLGRRKDEHRIEHLVRMREAVMEPFWESEYDRVIFSNDVSWCAEDVLRLLSHGNTDLACGMDFDGADGFYGLYQSSFCFALFTLFLQTPGSLQIDSELN